MITKRVVIKGRVQGVGFRHWMSAQAETLGVSGWVRNRSDGTVEALVRGEAAAVAELLRACHRGPRLAMVALIEEAPIDQPLRDEVRAVAGFRCLPTA